MAVAASLAKTPYEEWMEGAAQRKRDRDQTLAQARQFQSAAEVEKLRQTLEATERDVTEQLRKGDESTRARFAEARARVGGFGADLRATLSTAIVSTREVEWDDANERVVAREVERLGAIVLRERLLRDVNDDDLRAALLGAVAELHEAVGIQATHGDAAQLGGFHDRMGAWSQPHLLDHFTKFFDFGRDIERLVVDGSHDQAMGDVERRASHLFLDVLDGDAVRPIDTRLASSAETHLMA